LRSAIARAARSGLARALLSAPSTNKGGHDDDREALLPDLDDDPGAHHRLARAPGPEGGRPVGGRDELTDDRDRFWALR